jgi:pimeloyl-ACP methyl ester carboxylesterase
MIGKRLGRLLPLSFLVLALFISFGCSSGAGDPVRPNGDNTSASPLTGQDRFVCRMTIEPEGGSINLEWFALDFPPGTLTQAAEVEISETVLTRPHDGIMVGGSALHLNIEPANDEETPKRMISNSSFYTCTFFVNHLPEGSGDFSNANRYVDIVAEWESDGGTHSGKAWADRSDGTISHMLNQEEMTLAVVDYSHIPELTEEPIFTDDPGDLTGYYKRYVQGLEFHPKNLEPLGDRIPVILIHGLQLDNLGEPYEYSDEEANHGYSSWTKLFVILNLTTWVYDDFKFYWYCYPTGVEIFGDDGNGANLAKLIAEWAAANDEPELRTKPLVTIAHSMGGLVARDFMQNQGEDVFRVVTVGTPHYGSPIANIADDIGWGWVEDFLTPGVLDLASDEKITYWYFYPFIKHTCSLTNPDLGALNASFAEDDPHLVCLGGTSTTAPSPPVWDFLDYGGLTLLKLVTAPSTLKESTGGYHSDCVVPWRSQYYQWSDALDSDDLKRSSNNYHTHLMEDLHILWRLYIELIEIEQSYP